MKFILQRHDGVPMVTLEGFVFHKEKHKDYPSYCGAGKGLQEKLIPETFYGLRISAACHTHDDFWINSDKGDLDFLMSNALFLLNSLMIISNKGSIWLVFLRSYRAIKYFFAVNTVGKKIYKNG